MGNGRRGLRGRHGRWCSNARALWHSPVVMHFKHFRRNRLISRLECVKRQRLRRKRCLAVQLKPRQRNASQNQKHNAQQHRRFGDALAMNRLPMNKNQHQRKQQDQRRPQQQRRSLFVRENPAPISFVAPFTLRTSYSTALPGAVFQFSPIPRPSAAAATAPTAPVDRSPHRIPDATPAKPVSAWWPNPAAPADR